MWNDLIQACQNHSRKFISGQQSEQLKDLLVDVQSITSQIGFEANQDLPYGRYLIHEEKLFNIQLDIFSRSYTGDIHNHNTWGLFAVISGQLIAEDWIESDNQFQLERSAVFTKGSCQCFGPPVSDWHRVGTPQDGPQTLSLHIYGEGFNLEEGYYLNSSLQPVKAKRSAFGNNSVFEDALFRMK